MRIEPFNAVLYDDPTSEEDGVIDLSSVIALDGELNSDPYAISLLFENADLFDQWTGEGWLTRTDEAAMYIYRIGFRDITGELQQASAIVALNPDGPDGVAIAPQLIPVNAPNFSDLLVPMGMPVARATDSQGNHHRLWPLTQWGVQQTIADAVEAKGVIDANPPSRLVVAYESTEAFPPVALGLILAP